MTRFGAICPYLGPPGQSLMVPVAVVCGADQPRPGLLPATDQTADEPRCETSVVVEPHDRKVVRRAGLGGPEVSPARPAKVPLGPQHHLVRTLRVVAPVVDHGDIEQLRLAFKISKESVCHRMLAVHWDDHQNATCHGPDATGSCS